MSRVTPERRVLRMTLGSAPQYRSDLLAGEEPLELRVDGRSMAVTMRTPGADFDLAAGFLVGEGVISKRHELRAMAYCTSREADFAERFNILDLHLAPGVQPPGDEAARRFFTTSSCGLCGKASIDAVRTHSHFDCRLDALRVSPELLMTLPDRLRAAQSVFDQTGGLHAAALFNDSGELLVLREDVGRHNAVDKVIGWALREGRLPLTSTILMVSGRASFELVQKAVMAGVAMLCAVSAPSSLAAELAEESGVTLVGFLRSPSMVIYSGAERIRTKGAEESNPSRD